MTIVDRRTPAPSAPDLRDRFLRALDDGDLRTSEKLALCLTASSNPLPSSVCAGLHLPAGSSYAAAARQVLEEASVRTSTPPGAAVDPPSVDHTGGYRIRQNVAASLSGTNSPIGQSG